MSCANSAHDLLQSSKVETFSGLRKGLGIKPPAVVRPAVCKRDWSSAEGVRERSWLDCCFPECRRMPELRKARRQFIAGLPKKTLRIFF